MRTLLLLCLLGAAYAVPKQVTRIVGGSPTTVENYPYMSNMQYNVMGFLWMHACGGTLLTSVVVLSAGHCFEGDSSSEWRVRLGTSSASSGGSVHPISQIILHPQYDTPTHDNDLAIIRLSVPATYSDSVRAARIAGINYNPADGTTVTSLGWGSISSGGTFPEQLQEVDLNIINQEICAARYASLKTQPGFALWPDISDGMLCTGILNVGGKDTCQGDAGGPIVHDSDVIVGVTSWRYQCADPTYPSVAARVSYYSDWIVSNA